MRWTWPKVMCAASWHAGCGASAPPCDMALRGLDGGHAESACQQFNLMDVHVLQRFRLAGGVSRAEHLRTKAFTGWEY